MILKHWFEPKPPTEFQDPVLGRLVSRYSGVWCADLPFQEGSAFLLIPGSRRQPDADRLTFARLTVPSLPSLVQAARVFAAHKRPELTRERLVFGALNYFCGVATDDFGLDFTEVGDDSGNCWQVHFRLGQPTELDYT